MRGVSDFLVVLLLLAGATAWSPPAAAVLWTEGSSSYSGTLGGQSLAITSYSSGGRSVSTSTQWQTADLMQYTSSLKHKSASSLAFELPSGQAWDSKKLGWAYEAIYTGSNSGGAAALASTTASTRQTGALGDDFHFKVGLPTNIGPAQAPIPGTLALLGFGLAVLGATLRRRAAKGQA